MDWHWLGLNCNWYRFALRRSNMNDLMLLRRLLNLGWSYLNMLHLLKLLHRESPMSNLLRHQYNGFGLLLQRNLLHKLYVLHTLLSRRQRLNRELACRYLNMLHTLKLWCSILG